MSLFLVHRIEGSFAAISAAGGTKCVSVTSEGFIVVFDAHESAIVNSYKVFLLEKSFSPHLIPLHRNLVILRISTSHSLMAEFMQQLLLESFNPSIPHNPTMAILTTMMTLEIWRHRPLLVVLPVTTLNLEISLTHLPTTNKMRLES